MFAMPEKINAVCHPLINSMYIKHELGGKDVLVIETNFSQDRTDSELYDLYMTELLFDLDNLKNIAEEKSKLSHIDRVDIRTIH
jgi:kynurenine formamidase